MFQVDILFTYTVIYFFCLDLDNKNSWTIVFKLIMFVDKLDFTNRSVLFCKVYGHCPFTFDATHKVNIVVVFEIFSLILLFSVCSPHCIGVPLYRARQKIRSLSLTYSNRQCTYFLFLKHFLFHIIVEERRTLIHRELFLRMKSLEFLSLIFAFCSFQSHIVWVSNVFTFLSGSD